MTLGSPLIALAVPCRIVTVVDRQTRWGFAYGTLPGHPEQGEEAFIVSMAADQSVRFEIEAFSRPGDPLVKLSGPIGRAMQKGATAGYFRSLQRYVDAGAVGDRGPVTMRVEPYARVLARAKPLEL